MVKTLHFWGNFLLFQETSKKKKMRLKGENVCHVNNLSVPSWDKIVYQCKRAAKELMKIVNV